MQSVTSRIWTRVAVSISTTITITPRAPVWISHQPGLSKALKDKNNKKFKHTPHQSNMFCFYSDKKIYQVNWPSNRSFAFTIRCTDKNQTSSIHHGVNSGHERWWRYASIHLLTWPQSQFRGRHQAPERGSVVLDWEGVCRKTLSQTTRLCIVLYEQEEPVLGVRC